MGADDIKPFRSRARFWILAGIALLVLPGLASLIRVVYFPSLPAPQRPACRVDLNWPIEAGSRDAFYHTSQGSLVMPYRWFLALEQYSIVPLLPKNRRSFRDEEHLARFRLLPSAPSHENPDGLPVGLARTVFSDPVAGGEYLGLTCAACHTGELHYRGAALRIDGGVAMVNVNGFFEHMVLSLAVTVSPLRPWKFRRFAAAVLGDEDSPAARFELRKDVLAYLGSQFSRGHAGELEGTLLAGTEFGRMDALATGGNRLFMQLGELNFEAPMAPVVAQPLWSAYEFDWGLSNGSVRQPMARNVIQAIAVNAYVDLKGGRRYRSSVQLDRMAWMEAVVRSLEPPVWSEDHLGEIDRERADRGRALYARRCADCHARIWTERSIPPDPVSSRLNQRALYLRMLPLDKIGTDPSAALNFSARRVAGAGRLGIAVDEDGLASAALVISTVVSRIMERYYRDEGVDPELQARWGSGRSDLWRARDAYSARPLAGVWATPPFLHNGSVANIYQLLSPVTERDRVVVLGNLEYDPVRLGYRTERLSGTTRVDTRLPGNSNCGHEFRDPSSPPADHCTDPTRDTSRGKARIGPALTPEERWDLVEYLKVIRPEGEEWTTLFPNRPPPQPKAVAAAAS